MSVSESVTKALIGAWKLQRFEISFADGRQSLFPFGEQAQGLIIYSESGHMSAILSSDHRKPFSTSRLEDSNKASLEEKAQAFDSYLNYAGTYRIEGDEVVHSIELAQL